jgi:hypothetical protein
MARRHKCWHDDGPDPMTAEEIELDLWENKCMCQTGEISYVDWMIRVQDLDDRAYELGLRRALNKVHKLNKYRACGSPSWDT